MDNVHKAYKMDTAHNVDKAASLTAGGSGGLANLSARGESGGAVPAGAAVPPPAVGDGAAVGPPGCGTQWPLLGSCQSDAPPAPPAHAAQVLGHSCQPRRPPRKSSVAPHSTGRIAAAADPTAARSTPRTRLPAAISIARAPAAPQPGPAQLPTRPDPLRFRRAGARQPPARADHGGLRRPGDPSPPPRPPPEPPDPAADAALRGVAIALALLLANPRRRLPLPALLAIFLFWLAPPRPRPDRRTPPPPCKHATWPNGLNGVRVGEAPNPGPPKKRPRRSPPRPDPAPRADPRALAGARVQCRDRLGNRYDAEVLQTDGRSVTLRFFHSCDWSYARPRPPRWNETLARYTYLAKR
eukprot:gene9140-14_t